MSEQEIKRFHNQETEYVDWVDRNGGYILTNYTRGPGFSLHAAGCKHLGPYGASDIAKTTRKPRWWASSAQPLREFAREESGIDPHECALCMHHSSSGSVAAANAGSRKFLEGALAGSDDRSFSKKDRSEPFEQCGRSYLPGVFGAWQASNEAGATRSVGVRRASG